MSKSEAPNSSGILNSPVIYDLQQSKPVAIETEKSQNVYIAFLCYLLASRNVILMFILITSGTNLFNLYIYL